LICRVDQLSSRNDFQTAARDLKKNLEALALVEYSYSA
jgi:hypothetical protein